MTRREFEPVGGQANPWLHKESFCIREQQPGKHT